MIGSDACNKGIKVGMIRIEPREGLNNLKLGI